MVVSPLLNHKLLRIRIWKLRYLCNMAMAIETSHSRFEFRLGPTSLKKCRCPRSTYDRYMFKHLVKLCTFWDTRTTSRAFTMFVLRVKVGLRFVPSL